MASLKRNCILKMFQTLKVACFTRNFRVKLGKEKFVYILDIKTILNVKQQNRFHMQQIVKFTNNIELLPFAQ